MSEHDESQRTEQDHHEHKKHERKMNLNLRRDEHYLVGDDVPLTYADVFTWAHMTFRQERVYMALFKGSAMPDSAVAFPLADARRGPAEQRPVCEFEGTP